MAEETSSSNPANVPQASAAAHSAAREIHLKDLIRVVLHHWRMVALLAALAAGGAYLSGRDAVAQYRSQLTVQVSSPKQVFARVDDIDVDELALRTDPVLSEALVLTTMRLARKVVESLQLRLEIADPSVFRGDMFSSIAVDSAAPSGHYLLRQPGPPGAYELCDEYAKTVVWSGLQSQRVEGPGFSFGVIPAELPEQEIRFLIVTPEVAAAWVRGGLSYAVRSQTNAVDIRFTGTDPTLVPYVLNQAALQLRSDGAERAQETATQRLQYILAQLGRADSNLQDKLRELQTFKERQQITDLSAEEEALVRSIQGLEQQRQNVLIQISMLRQAITAGESLGVDALNRLAALDVAASNTAVLFQIRNLLQLYEERRALTAGALGLRENNPQVGALNQRIRSGHAALRTAVQAAADGLAHHRAALEAEIHELREQLGAFPGKETRIAQLEIERGILHDTYSYLLGQYQQAQMQYASISPYVAILDGASPPSRIGTGLRDKVILGLLVGLLLGLGGAFFLEYLDQTIKTAADVERVVGLPVLGMIPLEARLSAASNGARGPVVAINTLSPDDPSVEAFRSLRTNVTFVAAERPIQLVAVTSPGPGEGKSTAAVNLAIALAQSGCRVLLMDGDLRRPVLHRTFQLVAEPGLTDILVGHTVLRETVRPDIVNNLDVLPAGARPPNPSELLGSDAMKQLLDEIRREYDHIVIDTPPALPVTDATVVAANADAIIVVVRSGDTEEQAAQRTIMQLRRVHARIAGVVLNGISRRHEQYYSYYSYGGGSRRERSRVRGLRSRLNKIL